MAAMLVGEESSGGFTSTVTVDVPAGVQDDDVLVAAVSANDADDLTPPAGWTQHEHEQVAGTPPSGTAVWLYSRTADNEPADYTWTWNGAHWHHVIVSAWTNTGGVRSSAATSNASATSINMPSLGAQNGDVLVGTGFHWGSDADTTPEITGLTEIATQSTRLTMGYEEITSTGGTTQHPVTIEGSTSGRMAAMSLLLEPEDASSIIWQNSFDGTDETAVTPANSGDHGDPLSSVHGTVVYDESWSAAGSASARIGAPSQFSGFETEESGSSGPGAAWRVYLQVPATDEGLDISLDGAAQFAAITVWGDGSIDFPSGSGSGLPDDGSPYRLEMLLDGDAWTMRAYVSDIQGTTHDEEWSGTLPVTPEGPWTWWCEDWEGDGVHVDELAVSDTADWIGPAAFELHDGQAEGGMHTGGSAFGFKAASTELIGEISVTGFAEGPIARSGQAATTARLASFDHNGGFASSVSLNGIVPAGRFVVIYGTANDSDEIVSAPAHWTEETTVPLGGGRRTWLWTYTSTGEDDPDEVVWTSAHWHFLLRTTWYGATHIADLDSDSDTSTTSLALPQLDARLRDIALALGYHELETAAQWDPDDLTEIANLPRAIIAGYTVAEDGLTDPYMLTAADEGAMSTTLALVRGPGGVHVSGRVTVGSRTASGDTAGTVQVLGSVQVQRNSATDAAAATGVGASAAGFKHHSAGVSGAVEVAAESDGTQAAVSTGSGSTQVAAHTEGTGAHTGSAAGTAVVGGQASGTGSHTGTASGAVTVGGSATGTSFRLLPDVPVIGLRARLVVYEPDGERLGELPYPVSYNVGVPLNDMPSMALEYAADAPNAHLLSEPCEVALEVAPLDSLDYFEPHNCRFLLLREQVDIADRTGVSRYTLPHYAWMLRKICNINETAFDEDDKRIFVQATPGAIIRAFLLEGQNRGAAPGLVMGFTATHDSANQPWEQQFTVSFDAGQPLLSVLEAFAEQGALDWRFEERTLHLYNPDTVMRRDRRTQVVLWNQRDVQEAPNDRTIEEVASKIFVMGDEGSFLLEDNPEAITPWGEWEEAISQGGVSDTGTMAAFAQRRLELTHAPRVQMSRKVAFPTTRYLPFIHYRPGDRITGPGDDGTHDDLRVHQITIESLDPHSLDAVLVLNDRFIERELRHRRTMASLAGGSGTGPGGGGSPPGEDTRQPAVPDGFLIDSETFINEMGEARGQITASWLPVDTATDNSEMFISGYEVWVRHVAHGEQFHLQTEVDHPDTEAFMSPFEVGELYQVRVRAIGRNNRRGPYTGIATIEIDPDIIPPEAPSDPVLSSRLGVIRVFWDGLTHLGTDMPRDFDFVRVWMSDNPGSGFEHIDTIYREGIAVVPNQPYNEERFFFFTALDRSGNESDPSDTVSIATEQLIPPDVSPGSIGYELLEEGAVRDDILADDAVTERSIAAGAVTAEKVRAYSITADRIAVGNTRNLLSDPNLQSEDLNEVRLELSDSIWHVDERSGGQNAALISRSNVDNGTYRFFYVQRSDAESLAEPGAGIAVDEDLGRFITRMFLTITGLSSGTVSITGFVRFLDADGDQISNIQTTQAIPFSGSVSDVEIISGAGAEIPAGSMWAIPYVRIIFTGTPASTEVSFNRAFSATTNGTVLIEDGAVSANKIQANAITADKIQAGAIEAVHIQADAINTDQLAANAITAKHTITGAVVQTTTTANRGVRMTGTGLFAYDINGNQTFSVSAASGNVVTTGTYRSGLSGQNRVLISPSANYLNQPGINLISGGPGARDSSIFIDNGLGTGGWDPYSVVMTGSEVTRNSSGRTDLVLRHGSTGGGYLRRQFGFQSSIGVQFDGWDIFLRGRLTSGQGARDYQIWGRTSASGSTITNWTIEYGSTTENLGRLAMVVGHGRNVSNRMVNTAVTNQTNTELRVRAEASAGTNRVQYLTTWVNQLVSGS